VAFAEVGSGSQRASKNGVTSGGGASQAYPGNTTSGNLLLGVMVWWTSGGASSSLTVADTLLTSYSVIVSDAITLGSGTYRLGIWYGVPGSTGANTVTVTLGIDAFYSFSIDEFSGQHATPLSVSSTTPNTGTSTDPTASLTTLTSGELVIGIFGHGDGSAPSLSVDAPSTQFGEKETDNTDMAHSAAFRVGGAAGSHAIDWTSGASIAWGTLIASFKEAAGGGGGTTHARVIPRQLGVRRIA
jgi:hypothetical protein